MHCALGSSSGAWGTVTSVATGMVSAAFCMTSAVSSACDVVLVWYLLAWQDYHQLCWGFAGGRWMPYPGASACRWSPSSRCRAHRSARLRRRIKSSGRVEQQASESEERGVRNNWKCFAPCKACKPVDFETGWRSSEARGGFAGENVVLTAASMTVTIVTIAGEDGSHSVDDWLRPRHKSGRAHRWVWAHWQNFQESLWTHNTPPAHSRGAVDTSHFVQHMTALQYWSEL